MDKELQLQIQSLLEIPYRETFLFLDIETTGLYVHSGDEITTIVYYYSDKWWFWKQGQSIEHLKNAWENSFALVTFNGKRFDEPFICEFLKLDAYSGEHLDLYHIAKKKGLAGGLKKIAKALGFKRPKELDLVDGLMAIKLWHSYVDGNKDSLDNLRFYNAWDVSDTINLFNHLFDVQLDVPAIPWKPKIKSLDPFIKSLKAKTKTNKLKDKCFCFTLEFAVGERDDVEQFVKDHGGKVHGSAAKVINYLVIGSGGVHRETSKVSQAKRHISNGFPIEILTEKQFWALIKKCGCALNWAGKANGGGSAKFFRQQSGRRYGG